MLTPTESSAVAPQAVRRLILNLHLFIALLAGAFLIVFGVTGSIMAFEPELDHVLHARVSYVTPQGPPKTLAELGAAAASTSISTRARYLVPEIRVQTFSAACINCTCGS